MKMTIGLILAAGLGYTFGSYFSTTKLQKQAVNEGAAEYIIVSTDGHKDFRWIKPNCGPH